MWIEYCVQTSFTHVLLITLMFGSHKRRARLKQQQPEADDVEGPDGQPLEREQQHD